MDYCGSIVLVVNIVGRFSRRGCCMYEWRGIIFERTEVSRVAEQEMKIIIAQRKYPDIRNFLSGSCFVRALSEVEGIEWEN